jgi:hypothetical protein
MSATTHEAQGTRTVSQGESRYGSPEPQLEVRFPKGTSSRALMAALHRLAADVELATPAGERWLVHVEHAYDERGRVYVELADGTTEEAERALRVLASVSKGTTETTRWMTPNSIEPSWAAASST